MRSGSWGTLTSVEIRGLINDCLHSRASSTVAKYIREVRKFINFQEINSRPLLFPANVAHLALYLSTLLCKDSKTAVLSAYSALKWIHGFIPVQFNPLDFTICKNLVETEKQSPHPPVVKKEPVDLDMIKSLINNYASSDCNLKDLRFATMSTLLYVGLFRSQELLDMKLCDLDVTDTYLEVRLPKSKTDIYRLGETVFIPKSGLYTCPYSLLIRYLNMSKIDLNAKSDQFVFRNVVYHKSKGTYSLGNRKVSYSRLRELLKESLTKLGYDQSLYGLHSFRSGGATSLTHTLENNPSKERLLKLHGRWKTDLAKDMYIKESVDQRLSFVKNLGL